MIGWWLMVAAMLGFSLWMGLVLTFDSDGIRRVISGVLVAFWFVVGTAMLTQIATAYPLFFIRPYVWMGPQYVLAINVIASVFVELVTVAIFAVTVR